MYVKYEYKIIFKLCLLNIYIYNKEIKLCLMWFIYSEPLFRFSHLKTLNFLVHSYGLCISKIGLLGLGFLIKSYMPLLIGLGATVTRTGLQSSIRGAASRPPPSSTARHTDISTPQGSVHTPWDINTFVSRRTFCVPSSSVKKLVL